MAVITESVVQNDSIQAAIPLEALPKINEELQSSPAISSLQELQQYPTGFKFNILLLAVGMSLILVGLVNFSLSISN